MVQMKLIAVGVLGFAVISNIVRVSTSQSSLASIGLLFSVLAILLGCVAIGTTFQGTAGGKGGAGVSFVCALLCLIAITTFERFHYEGKHVEDPCFILLISGLTFGKSDRKQGVVWQ